MRAKTFKPWTLTDNTQIGQTVEWQVLCSALSPPGGTTTSYIRYGDGIDKITEIMMLAIDIGIIANVGNTICGCAISVLEATTPKTAITRSIASTRKIAKTDFARIPIVSSAISAMELPWFLIEAMSVR